MYFYCASESTDKESPELLFCRHLRKSWTSEAKMPAESDSVSHKAEVRGDLYQHSHRALLTSAAPAQTPLQWAPITFPWTTPGETEQLSWKGKPSFSSSSACFRRAIWKMLYHASTAFCFTCHSTQMETKKRCVRDFMG